MGRLSFFLLSLPAAEPLPQPGPTWLFWALLLLTFLLHVIAMNFALGGSVIALAVRLTARGSAPRREFVTWFARALPTLLAATITFGVAPLLFLQVLHGRAFFASAIVMAWPWLSVIGLLVLTYYGAYRLAFAGAGWQWWHAPLAGLVTAGLLAIAFIYGNNMSLMLAADRFGALTASGVPGWHWNVADATLAPRVLHMVLGAIAVAGVGLGLLGLVRRSADAVFARWAMRAGSGWATVATLLNVIVGFWWLLALPREVMLQFMGRDPVAAVALMIGVVLGLVTLTLTALAWRATNPAPVILWAAGTMTATLVAMILSRDHVRSATFTLIGLEPTAWIELQWGPAALFAVCLIGALGLVVWMVRLLAEGDERAVP